MRGEVDSGTWPWFRVGFSCYDEEKETTMIGTNYEKKTGAYDVGDDPYGFFWIWTNSDVPDEETRVCVG